MPPLIALLPDWHRISYHLRYRDATGFGITCGTGMLPDLVSLAVPRSYLIWYLWARLTGFDISNQWGRVPSLKKFE